MRRLTIALAAWALLLAVAAAIPGVVPGPLGPERAYGASPQPSSGTGDTRSAGEAPGFVGAPLVAIAAVLGLGALAAVATVALVRLTGGPGGADGADGPDGATAPPTRQS